MDEIYESGEYLSKNRAWHAEDSAWKAEQISAAMRRSNLPVAHICDVGCGAGEVAHELSARFPEATIVGFDISPQAHQLAKAKEAPRCRYVLGSPFGGPERYDVAMAIDVFEHIEDCYGFLRCMKDLAKYKVFHIPLDMSALAVATNNPMFARREVGHLHYFSKDTAIATLRDCGYEVLEATFTNSGWADVRNTLKGGRVARKLAKLAFLTAPRLVLAFISKPLCARILGGLSLLVVAK